MNAESGSYEASSASIPHPHDTNVLLVVKAASVGSLGGVQITRWYANRLDDVKIAAWVRGQLTASTLTELEAVLVDQLRLALMATVGIPAELFTDPGV